MADGTAGGTADAIFATLKQILRRRGLTYADLAARLGLSESGVKKLFAARNASLERLLAITEALDVPLAEVLALAERPAIRDVSLGEAQQRYLLEHFDVFAFFWKLAIERLPVARIRARYGLDEARTRRYLRELDDLGLVVIEQPGDRVRVRHDDLTRWRDSGPLMEVLNQSWSRRVLDDVLRAPEGAARVFRLSQLRLRRETARELDDALERLADEFARRARYEQATTEDDALVTRRLLLASAEGSFVTQIAPPAAVRERGGD